MKSLQESVVKLVERLVSNVVGKLVDEAGDGDEALGRSAALSLFSSCS
jgi:hypothetical protein